LTISNDEKRRKIQEDLIGKGQKAKLSTGLESQQFENTFLLTAKFPSSGQELEQRAHFLQLSEDLIWNILNMLPDLDCLRALSCTCKQLSNVLKRERFSSYQVCVKQQIQLRKEPNLSLHQNYWMACFGITLDTGSMVLSPKDYRIHVQPKEDLKQDLRKRFNKQQYNVSQEAQSLFGSLFILHSKSDSSLLHCCVDPSKMFFFPLSNQITWILSLSHAERDEPEVDFEASSLQVSVTFNHSQKMTEHSFDIRASFACREFGNCTARFHMIQQESVQLLWVAHHHRSCAGAQLNGIHTLPRFYLSSFLKFAANLLGQQMEKVCFYSTNPFDLENEYAHHSLNKKVGRNQGDISNLILRTILNAILVTPEHNKTPPKIAFLFVAQEYLGLLYRFIDNKGENRLALECWSTTGSTETPKTLPELMEQINSLFLKEIKLSKVSTIQNIILKKNFQYNTSLKSILDPISLHVWLLLFLSKVSKLDGLKRMDQNFPLELSTQDKVRWSLILQPDNQQEFIAPSFQQVQQSVQLLLKLDGSLFALL